MDDTQPQPGEAILLEDGIRRVLAPNPSPMTYWGTNTYLLGEGDVAVLDPGPALPNHLEAIQAALRPGEKISHVLVSHSHIDHSPLARPLSEASCAPVFAFGNSFAGRSDVMKGLAAQGLTGGGEGVDTSFEPDETLADGDVLSVGGWQIEVLWTPGHMANHLSFAVDGALFSGDLVMGWASTMVSPPDGDLTAFMTSAQRLSERSDRIFYPGHGAPIPEPQSRTRWLIEHRKGRESQILDALGPEPRSIPEITAEIYDDVPPALLPAAQRNVFAHLIDLHFGGSIRATPELAATAHYFV